MVLLNTTFVISPEAIDEVISWVKETYFPAALDQERFFAPMLYKVLPREGEEDYAPSYAAQLHCTDHNIAKEWIENGTGAELLCELHKRLGENMLWFTTFMEATE